MIRGDKVRVAQNSPWKERFGDAVGDVEAVSAKTGRVAVHFPTLKWYAEGWEADNFEPVPTGQDETLPHTETPLDRGTTRKHVAN